MKATEGSGTAAIALRRPRTIVPGGDYGFGADGVPLTLHEAQVQAAEDAVGEVFPELVSELTGRLRLGATHAEKWIIDALQKRARNPWVDGHRIVAHGEGYRLFGERGDVYSAAEVYEAIRRVATDEEVTDPREGDLFRMLRRSRNERIARALKKRETDARREAPRVDERRERIAAQLAQDVLARRVAGVEFEAELNRRCALTDTALERERAALGVGASLVSSMPHASLGEAEPVEPTAEQRAAADAARERLRRQAEALRSAEGSQER